MTHGVDAPRTSFTKENLALVENMVLEDRRMTLTEIASALCIGLGKVHEIIHVGIGMSKVSVRWVPRLLGPEQKRTRVEHCEILLSLVEEYGDQFWARIITTDESWIPYYDPETKEQSKEWRRPRDGLLVKARSSSWEDNDYSFLGL